MDSEYRISFNLPENDLKMILSAHRLKLMHKVYLSSFNLLFSNRKTDNFFCSDRNFIKGFEYFSLNERSDKLC